VRATFEKLKNKNPLQAGATGLFFASLAPIYSAVVKTRLFLYSSGILKGKKVDSVKTVSIGNITVGGTGKTPVTIMVTKLLLGAGLKPAVVSRGYGRESTDDVQVVSDGKSILARFPIAGDEPLLTASEIKTIPVISSPVRFDGISHAKKKFGIDTVVLDDGFSHLQSHRDLNLLLIDGLNPFGNGWILPAGILREPLSSIKRADAVLITRTNFASEESIDKIKTVVKVYGGETNFFLIDMVMDEVITEEGNRVSSDEFLRGKKVSILSGIATPDQFRQSLITLGADVTASYSFDDHHPFSESEIEEVLGKCGKEVIITTQKDFVRIPQKYQNRFCQLTLKAIAREEEAFRSLLLERLKT